MQYGIISGGEILPTVRVYLLYKRKSSELFVVTHTRIPCRSLSKKLEILPIPNQYTYFHSCISLLTTKKIFRQILQSLVLKQGIMTIFTDQLPTYPVFRRVHSILVSEYSTTSHVGSQILRIKNQTLK